MKIYTRTGDEGNTGLFGGPRVSKDDLRIEAYGTADELNSILGAARAALPRTTGNDGWSEQTGEAAGQAGPSAWQELDGWLARIQNELFDLGADLATPLDSKASVGRIHNGLIEALESDIDRMESDLQPLTNFILPGGVPVAAQLHVARTVCRRAERRVVTLSGRDEINDQCTVYLNRLSDALFVAARWANAQAGSPDLPWSPRTSAGD